jgi:hypothetical protein
MPRITSPIGQLLQLLVKHGLIKGLSAWHILEVNLEPNNGVPMHGMPPDASALIDAAVDFPVGANADRLLKFRALPLRVRKSSTGAYVLFVLHTARFFAGSSSNLIFAMESPPRSKWT